MNRDNSIQPSLLDLIFDHRNKEYGAYLLRKEYPARMVTSMGVTLVFAILFSIGILCDSTKARFHKVVKLLPVGDTWLSAYQQVHPSGRPKTLNQAHRQKIRLQTERFVPRMVNFLKINNSPMVARGQDPVSLQLAATGAITDGGEVPVPIGEGGEKAPLPVVSKKPASHQVLEHAEVMPEFPGGIKALIKYLQRNIHPPQGLQGDQEVVVRVRFIVDFAGKPEGFQVLQSGGAAFDNEVLRVLQKMPDWIAGSNKGQKVSVFCVVPVRFITEF